MAASPDLIIGLDSSTTSCKAIAWDRHGQAVSIGRAPLPLFKPQPTWHEQPAESWWQAASQALREMASQVNPKRFAAICIAPQRETFVITDEDFQPLMNSLLWMDERCRDMLPEIDQQYGKKRIHQETGKPLSANLSLGKLFWLRKHRPEMLSGFTRILDVHAFLAGRLTGHYVTAWGCADPTGLFDMRRNTWNRELIQAIGFTVDQFPQALPAGQIVGEVDSNAAHICGLPAGLPLVAGIGDGQAAGLGANVTQPGDAYLNLGTAVVTGTCSNRYLIDPAFRTMYAGIPGAFSLETVLLGGTYTINWFLEHFVNLQPTDSRPVEAWMEDEAGEVPPGAMGLILVPYWNSAMNPYWDASASGIIAGWRGIHGRPHLYRAILEGIAFEQRLHTEGVEAALGQKVTRFLAVGGGAQSSLWRQIIADISGRPVFHASTPEATALGAGILAAVAAGFYPDIATAAQSMTSVEAEANEPRPAQQDFYNRLHEDVYRHLFPALQTYLTRLAEIIDTQPL